MAARVFISYSHADEAERDHLGRHLSALRRQGLIAEWHDRRIPAGGHIDQAIDRELERADIVLLLVSASFIASDYCYSREMTRALERQAAGEAQVVPVIVKPCLWHGLPFGAFRAVPRDGRAITSWPNVDEAYTDVARELRELVAQTPTRADAGNTEASTRQAAVSATSTTTAARPHSPNVHLGREYSDLDKSRFLSKAFEYIAQYVEHSLSELKAHNEGIDFEFLRVDKVLFTALVYRNGKQASACAVRLNQGERFGGAITYSDNASRTDGNAYNERLTVEANGEAMSLRSLGGAAMTLGGVQKDKLTQEEAAELLWKLLMWRLH